MEGQGLEKFKDVNLLATSLRRSWRLFSAEIRTLKAGEFEAFAPLNAEITQVIADTGLAASTRASGGVRQEVVAVPEIDVALPSRDHGGGDALTASATGAALVRYCSVVHHLRWPNTTKQFGGRGRN